MEKLQYTCGQSLNNFLMNNLPLVLCPLFISFSVKCFKNNVHEYFICTKSNLIGQILARSNWFVEAI